MVTWVARWARYLWESWRQHLSFYLELPLGITGCVLLALALLYGYTSPKRWRVGAVAAIAFVLPRGLGRRPRRGSPAQFHGPYRYAIPAPAKWRRSLYNGRTLPASIPACGTQSPCDGILCNGGEPVSCQYRPSRGAWGSSGSGPEPWRCTGRGDSFRFYEINPAVIQVASRYFHFLGESQASTDVVEGDGRLALRQEPSKTFDVIVVDAFSDDSIPVHLLTREAFQTYFGRLRDGGILAIHVTNRYLDLAPVIEAGARSLQKGPWRFTTRPIPGCGCGIQPTGPGGG
jgi:hypothetical protein